MLENASYIGLTRQIALQRKLDIVANNIANVNTAGFKRDMPLFEEYIMPNARMTSFKPNDQKLSYVNDSGLYRDFSQGDLQKTGAELDVAISGPGWFVVQTPDGERYTRNGHFHRNDEGALVTSEGHAVMGEGGPITIGIADTNIAITEDATITTNLGDRGRFRIVDFNNKNQLKKEGASYYSSTDAPVPGTQARTMQGIVEKSNVKPVLQLTEMIQTTRAYISTTRMIQQAHELRQGAISRLGGAQQN
ncbi:MAG: flagellar basal-body rod protein FlgF [Pseudomonadota bacterium]